ncbi:hypothetical protein [Streptomyces sp. NPDC001568]|uniref:hypothetical protein n=1 Tax=Streptomyces sp. NPDC001568 TaxID=3364588 RepID=UPI003697CFDC
MATFPDGNFTIVKNETGRCVRVRLGRTKDVSDWQAGTQYPQHVTEKPTLELVAETPVGRMYWAQEGR